jgi:NAD(P)-dependent dehydrogenase (short-subunit alcohol dehydrogenase family)
MSNQRWLTKDGFEYQFQVNYLSHYLLTRCLLNKLTQNNTFRIVNVTSKLYESALIDWDDLNLENEFLATKGYQRSKLFNILFTNYLKGMKNLIGGKLIK